MQPHYQKNYTYFSWGEVQEDEIDCWFKELNNATDVIDGLNNWKDIENQIRNDINNCDVEEEFTYDTNEWINEILTEIKPDLDKYLHTLLQKDQFLYAEYAKNFWGEFPNTSTKIPSVIISLNFPPDCKKECKKLRSTLKKNFPIKIDAIDDIVSQIYFDLTIYKTNFYLLPDITKTIEQFFDSFENNKSGS